MPSMSHNFLPQALAADHAKTDRSIAGRALLALAALALLVLISACASEETAYPDDQNRKTLGEGDAYTPRDSIFGPGGLSTSLFGGGGDAPEVQGGGSGVAVNAYLWRASLDTLSFMPLQQVDPHGGVIITDWYTPPESPGERFKINVRILGRELRADGISASVFRQTAGGGAWVDAPVSAETKLNLENAILTRAREMRIAGIQ